MSDQALAIVEVQEQACIPTMCRGCEEDFVEADSLYCKWCGLMKKALEERFETRSKFFRELPREDVGVVQVADAIRPIGAVRRKPEMYQVRLSDILMTAGVCVGCCWFWWYGVRWIAQLGLMATRHWVQ